MFAWGWQTWGPAQRIEPFPEILRCIVCCGDGGAALLENREMRAPKGFTFEIYMWATRRSARVVGLNSLASYLTEYSEFTILILPAHDR